MRCPTCEGETSPGAIACAQGHVLAGPDGVIRLLPDGLAAQVHALETAVETWRREAGRTTVPVAAHGELPGGDAVRGDPEWRLRRADLALVRRLLAARRGGGRAHARLRVLDVGAWNGWLSARLSDDGHAATALDLFAGPAALGVRSQVAGDWRAVQGDPTDLARLGESFDVVIFDRCLGFQPDPVAALRSAIAVLAPGGSIIVTGIAIHPDLDRVRRRLDSERQAFRGRFGMELLLRPTAGVLDGAVLRQLGGLGMVVRDHPFLRIANVRARFDRTRPRHQYGVVDRP